ncbi:NDUFA12-domain-containing protein [Acaromyces ingoldii]|uniref:NADH dehydrogenase [ubiquinone] 1 alpha subcomplex subunit n=1 Tax=Acaromyces ingoldii TaxID=215250 RepID=A0A316YNP1_9BASI|nr:NDUFA12-domain-containing protein [Acaromyces ingoldii]PWN90997.1 NDUFA12-domain-containing protein [Acaromyces ingoldii]
MSLARQIRNARVAGLKKYWRDLQYIGDAKAGTFVGADALGNKFYEDLNEQPGRHRWVDYAGHDSNAYAIEPVWHSWLHHIKQDPPNKDPIVAASRKTWEIHRSGPILRQSRQRFETDCRVAVQNAWEPTIASRQ